LANWGWWEEGSKKWSFWIQGLESGGLAGGNGPQLAEFWADGPELVGRRVDELVL
jgi:hypothetical protein